MHRTLILLLTLLPATVHAASKECADIAKVEADLLAKCKKQNPNGGPKLELCEKLIKKLGDEYRRKGNCN